MKILKGKITKAQLKEQYASFFKTMTKGVVDIKKEIIALDAEMHADLEEKLLEDGSEQENLWGFNLYPGKEGDDFIEYTSLINIRPHQQNKSMEIKNLTIKKKIRQIVGKFIA